MARLHSPTADASECESGVTYAIRDGSFPYGKLLCSSRRRERIAAADGPVLKIPLDCRFGKRQGMQARKKSPSRLDKRKEMEAVEELEKSASNGTTKKKTAKKKAAKKKTTRRTKVKAPQRKRLVWAVLSGSMKEEARFPYDQRKDAEKKLEQLRAKATKKMYFIQPVKEPLPDAPAAVEEEDAVKAKAAK